MSFILGVLFIWLAFFTLFKGVDFSYREAIQAASVLVLAIFFVLMSAHFFSTVTL